MNRARWIVASAVQGMIALDADGTILSWNASARRILGRKAEDVVGRSCAATLPELGRALKKLEAGGATDYAEASVACPHGRTADVALTALPLAEPAGARLLLVRDISERKRFEKKLAGSLEALERAQEIGGLASWTWDLGRDEITWSAELYKMLGIDRSVSKSSYRRLLARVSPEDRERFRAAMDDTLRQGAPLDLRHGLIGRGGTRVEVRSRARIIESAAGERRLVGTCQRSPARAGAPDVRRDLKRLGKSWGRRIFFLAEAALILFDTLEPREALARLCRAVVPRVADHFDVDLLGRPALEESDYEWEPRVSGKALDPGGKRIRSRLVLPIQVPDGVAGTMTVLQSESRRRIDRADVLMFQYLARLAGQAIEHGRLYAEAKELNRELETRVEHRTAELREALQDLDAYASAVAHDLRAPLRILRSFTEALREECVDLGAQGLDYAGRICAACARLDSLVLDLLAYSRVSRRDLELAPLDLTELVDDVLRRMEDALKASKARVSVEHPLGRARGNGLVLAQVLTNLIDNAAKFVPRGGTPEIRVRAEEIGGSVRLWVEDNGVGVAREDQARIFRPFERLHPESVYPGTGLGLAIARRGVERMGGRVGLESEPGRGSRFWIELPSAAQDA